MYTIPGDPVAFRRQRRLRRHKIRIQASTIIQLLFVASVLLTAAAQGSWR